MGLKRAIDHLTAESATTLQNLPHFCYAAVRQQGRYTKAVQSWSSLLNHQNKPLHVYHAHAYMTLCRKCTSIEVQCGNRAVRQPKGPPSRQPSNPALVTPFHLHKNPMYVHHYQACMALCAKRNSIELAVRQPGIEAVQRSSRAVRLLSNSYTVSRS